MTTPNLYFWPNGIRNSLVYQDCITLQPYEFVNKKNSEGNDDKKSLRVPKEKNANIILILLPIPNSIQFNDGIVWSTEDLKAVGDQLKEIVSAARGTEDERLGEIARNVGTGLGAEALLGRVSGIQSLGLTKNSITQSLGKKILNPYTEQIFQGIGLRSFSFNWKLVPRDEDEQEKIFEIIKNLRVYSTPNISGASFDEVIFGQSPPNNNEESSADVQKLSDRWLTLPSSWKIQFIHVENGQSKQMKFIPKLKYCVITDINVNYTPDGYWSTHYTTEKQPAPVAYDLSINFQETEIITSDLIDKGY